MQNLRDYFSKFENKYNNIESIDKYWYQNECGVISFNSKQSIKDKNKNYSEEWYRARLVWSLVHSGFYPKEYICVEFSMPKGNSKTPLKPDILVFKNKDWYKNYEEAKANKDFSKIRQNMLVVFEAKKNSKTVESAIENQLRSAMSENESEDRIFGVYFDKELDILIFKKFGNSPIRRFDETLELNEGNITDLNYSTRDLLNELPKFDDFMNNNAAITDLEKLTIDSLDAIDETNFTTFMAQLKRDADRLKPKHSVRDLIVEFLTLKVFDEKRSKREHTNLSFYIKREEKKKDGTAEIAFRERIINLYKEAKKEYSNVLSKPFFSYDASLRPSDINEERFLIALVENFQKRAILKAKNENFNQIIFNNFGDEKQKADNGQYFTPIPVVKTIIRMLNPTKNEELCDPCCGICDFPAMAFKYAHRKEKEYPQSSAHYYGFDLVKDNLKLAELNLVLNGDGGATLLEMDSLKQKYLINEEVSPLGDFNTENYNQDWVHKSNKEKDIKKFKIIATNPPFGKGRDLKIPKDIKQDVIDLYETYKVKSSLKKDGTIELPKSMDMGALFLENTYKLLEPGGRMAIVLSNSIASIKEWENIRAWIIERMRIVALFDLPSNTFGETGVSTTVIIAYKPKKNEEFLLSNDYEIYIKDIENIGYEVKTNKRTIEFHPKFVIDEESFETTNKLEEDFSEMVNEFKEFLNHQEIEIKQAFNYMEFD